MKFTSDQYNRPFKETLDIDYDMEFKDRIGSLAIMTRLITPALNNVRKKFEGMSARVNITNIAMVCNAYHQKNGNYPETLDALGKFPLDAATNQPYIYKKTEKGYVIYSPYEEYGGSFEYTIDGKSMDKLIGVEVK